MKEKMIVWLKDGTGKSSTAAMLCALLTGHGVKNGWIGAPWYEKEQEKVRYQRKPLSEAFLKRYEKENLFSGKWMENLEEVLKILADKDCQVVIAEESSFLKIESVPREWELLEISLEEWRKKAVSEGKIKRHFAGKHRFSWNGYENLELLAYGDFQAENAMAALSLFRLLQEKGLVSGKEKKIREILERVPDKKTGKEPGEFLPYSFSVYGKPGLFVGAVVKDRQSAVNLSEFLGLYFTNRHKILIISMNDREDVQKSTETLAAMADMILTVTEREEGMLSSTKLAERLQKWNGNVTGADSLEEAGELGRLLAGKQGVLTAAGTERMVRRFAALVSEKQVTDSHGILPEK